MRKIAVIYWSGSGNTAAMAQAIAQGAQETGAEVRVYQTEDFRPELLLQMSAVAFGCPAMGIEALEEEEFLPLFDACIPNLIGREIALFGSYGWGDGAWMRRWEEKCQNAGILLPVPGLICRETPGKPELEKCHAFGRMLLRSK